MVKKEPRKHFSEDNRIQFEAHLKAGHQVPEAGDLVGCSRSTAYAEYNRGLVGPLLRSDLTTYYAYDAYAAQRDYDEKATAKGPREKLGNDLPFALFISEQIREEKYSPYSALMLAKEEGVFHTDISVRTLYTYIDRDYIPGITNKDLPMRGECKREYKKTQARIRKPLQRSIEERPAEILKRQEFGHWELDTVVGKRDGKNSVLAVFTERQTRDEYLFKVEGKTQTAIVGAVDQLERMYGEDFSKVFKSITMDNGGEFLDNEGIERSIFNHLRKRTTTYYCHPYASSERGSNENQNKLVRRWIPKGAPIDDYDDEYIEHIQNWMNNMPRRKLKGRSAGGLFAEQLAKLGINFNAEIVA